MPRSSSLPQSHKLELDFHKDSEVLSKLASKLDLGLFSVDSKARFVAWSQGAERITGFSPKDVLGQDCKFLEGPNCKGFRGLSELLASGTAEDQAMENQECRVLAKDSRVLRLLGSVSLLRDASGKVYGALGSFTDVTEVLALNAPALPAEAAEGLAGLIGQSLPMEEVFRRIRLASDSDVTTLITGESGTGKELAARAIHALSDRKDKPFIAINCSAIPESLLESELFGHVKGAFTGAIRDRAGVFESAEGGTLLLDEIGDISPLIQLKLLRVLQEREIQRVGDDKCIPIDVRLLTATNRDLMQRVREGEVREDFYYRIRVFDLCMPALRERASDIPILAQHFVKQISLANGKGLRSIARDAIEVLMQYRWPGNVRELYNTMEHALVVQQGESVGLLDLPPDVRGARAGSNPEAGKNTLTAPQTAEKLRILDTLDQHAWNRTKTALSLGISRVTLWKKIRRYRIDEGIFKQGTRHTLG